MNETTPPVEEGHASKEKSSSKRPSRSLLAILFLGVVGVICFFVLPLFRTAPSSSARLLLVISVDQFAYQYIDRFHDLYSGGLKRILDSGTLFSNANFGYADTSTCPGHATIVSGVYPSRSGIVSNAWFDRREHREVYCVDDNRYGRSPKRMLVSSLPDWIQGHTWRGKVFTASGKDRSAITLGGKRADGAFWYKKESGTFTSSPYYSAAGRGWVSDFNNENRLLTHFGELWNQTGALEQEGQGAPGNRQIVQLDQGVFPDRFPHRIGSASVLPGESFYRSIYATPFVDEHLGEFAKRLIVEERLGQDLALDFLGLSFSALDTVGHRFGPNSPEVLDTLLRLDKTLDELFALIEQEIGLNRVLIVFTADHGIQPLPEYRHHRGEEAHRIQAADSACIQRAGKAIVESFGIQNPFLSHLYVNRQLLEEHEIGPQVFFEELASNLERCPTVQKAWTASAIKVAVEQGDEMGLKFSRSVHPERSPDIFVQPRKFHLHSFREGTNHGSPYAYDTHVPVVFAGPGVSRRIVDEAIGMVDLAPTVAELLGVDYPKGLDGVSRVGLLGSSE
jgi:predicted AlkP superfamily pyrophosphatase or phosphodiesterase